MSELESIRELSSVIADLRAENAQLRQQVREADTRYMQAYNEACDDLRCGFELERLEFQKQLAEVERRTWELCVTIAENFDGGDERYPDTQDEIDHWSCKIADAIRREFKEGE